MKLGICMDGLEDFFAANLSASSSLDGVCSYLEIGVASCETLFAAAGIMQQLVPRWRCVGVDLPTGYTHQYKREIKHKTFTPRFEYSVATPVLDNQVTVYLIGSDAFWTANKMMFNCILIDGCHCRMCAAKDFVACEPFVKPGGCVMFHDAGEIEQGSDPQYGHGVIEVNNALRDLGLIAGTRQGWTPVKFQRGRPQSMAATWKSL